MSDPDAAAAAFPPGSDAAVSDPEALDRLRKWGGDALVDAMVGLFLSQAPERIAAARAGLAAAAPDDVRRAMHALRSSSGQVGACRIQALCAAIESRAAEHHLTGVAGLLLSLEREFNRYETQGLHTGTS